jgi:hypothetical protein
LTSNSISESLHRRYVPSILYLLFIYKQTHDNVGQFLSTRTPMIFFNAGSGISENL